MNQEMKEALKRALSRLEWFIDAYPHDIAVSKEEFLRSFKEALAQPEQEPAAWMREDGTLRFAEGKVFAVNQPFYTTPPQRTWGKPWASLTEEEIQAVAKQARSKDHAVTLTNKLLKEKNT